MSLSLSADGSLIGGRPDTGSITIASPLTTGLGHRRWCPYGAGPEMASDQRLDDAGSARFDSAPLSEGFEILGAAEATLDLASDRPVALVAARLVDVAPDGTATLVSYGLLNLCHRAGHHRVLPLDPGDPVRVSVKLNHVGYAFPKGHRIRLSLSSNYWPIAWPSPEPVALTLLTGDARLHLPRYIGRGEFSARVMDYPPHQISGLRQRLFRPGGYNRRIETDMGTGEVAVTATKDIGHWMAEDTGVTCEGVTIERYSLRPPDPLSTEVEVRSTNAMERSGWRVEMRARTLVRCTADVFQLDLDLDASENKRRLFHKSWHVTVPRRGV